MTIYEEKRGRSRRFVLDRKLAGRRIRNYFSTKRKAEAAMAEQIREKRKLGDMFARYSEAVRVEWVMAHEIALENGFSVIDAVRYYADRENAAESSHLTLGEAIRAFLRDKKQHLRPRSYVALESTLERFGDWNMALTKVDRAVIIDWLESGIGKGGKPWTARTRNNYLTDLKNFFNWCVTEEYLNANPADRVRRYRASDEEMAKREDAKQILTPEESESLIRRLQSGHPDMVPRFALMLFAGLRPDREAATITWNEIDLEAGLIHVRASRAKDRQNRYIPISGNLREWLEWSQENGGELPCKNWRKRLDPIKQELGLFGENWPHDATRHSFASYHLALNGEEATKAALGHGTYDMLFQHYRTLVKADEAEKYFQTRP